MNFNYQRPDKGVPLSIEDLDTSFLRFPRVRFIKQETPLEYLGKLNSGAQLWVKRDDLLSVGLGGNKVRKLEFVLADALLKGKSTIVTAGAEQSNHLRITAACCAKIGLKCHVFFASKTGGNSSGNQDLAKLFGAEIHLIKGDLDSATKEALNFVEKHGGLEDSDIYFIPTGASVGLGCMGYALCYSEISHQVNRFAVKSNFIYLAASTMGTLGGLVCGASLMLDRRTSVGISAESFLKITAVNVDSAQLNPYDTVTKLCKETLSLLGKQEIFNSEIFEIITEPTVCGQYGVPTQISDFAMKFAAQNYGLVLDRTYSAKAFGQILFDDEIGKFKPSDNIIFLHTGGIGSNFSNLDNYSLASVLD